MVDEFPAPEPDEIALIQQVQQLWNSGNQPQAVDALRPRAEAGRPWAVALMGWLTMQQGAPAIMESIDWAMKAAELGLPTQVVQTFNNAVGQIPSVPGLSDRLLPLLQLAIPWMGGVDLVGQGWSIAQQGQPALGISVMMLPAPLPQPQWAEFLAKATRRIGELDTVVQSARAREQEVADHAAVAFEQIDKSRDELVTSAQQAQLLVATVTSKAANALFDADADRNTRETKGVWVAGLIVLVVAAVGSIVPVVLAYFGKGLDYSSAGEVAVHIASTAALGTLAGVLLARARARDRAAQRARELSTAMGTMITYSSQISDPAEQQRFIMMMGQLILQARLTSGGATATADDTMAGAVAIANLIKPSGTSPAAAAPVA